MQLDHKVNSKKYLESKRLAPIRWIIIICSGLLIFGLGVGIGSGKINFGTRGIFPKNDSSNLPRQLDYSSLNEVYNALKSQYDGQLDPTKLLDGLKGGLAQATGDPYTEYFSPNRAKQFNDQLNGSFTGIGAELGSNSQNNLVVVSPIDGFPAAKAGLRAQDIIASINGTSTNGLSLSDAVNKIRGPKGTKVVLDIIRGAQTLSLTITRDDIKVPSVKSSVINNNIGYLQISQFSNDTADLVHKAAQSFIQANVKGIVLDLRDNPGGLLDAAVQLSSLWLPNGKTILQEKRGTIVVNNYLADGSNTLNGIPTVVLINAGSASASEITAGALHDNGVATLIGVTSYGKGSVQQITNLNNGGELKITIAHWYRPNGQNIDHKGISPDQVVKMSENDFKAGLDPQKDAALQYLAAHVKQ